VNEALNAGQPAFGFIEFPFTVEDLGGWQAARAEIVEAVWKDHVLATIQP
jgi:hypothetical protein